MPSAASFAASRSLRQQGKHGKKNAEILLQRIAQPDQGRALPRRSRRSPTGQSRRHTKGDQFKPEYLAVNPNAKVPAIVDEDVTVFDSNAILLYLAEKTGNSCRHIAANRGQICPG